MENDKKLAILIGKRLSYVLQKKGLQQADLTKDGLRTESQVSKWINGKTLIRIDTMKDIQEKFFPDIRIDFLMGLDDYETEKDYEQSFLNKCSADSSTLLLEWALNIVCTSEKIEIPQTDIGEVLLMQAQLKDYAISLMRNYVHRKESFSWQWLDYMDSVKKENELYNDIED